MTCAKIAYPFGHHYFQVKAITDKVKTKPKLADYFFIDHEYDRWAMLKFD